MKVVFRDVILGTEVVGAALVGGAGVVPWTADSSETVVWGAIVIAASVGASVVASAGVVCRTVVSSKSVVGVVLLLVC